VLDEAAEGRDTGRLLPVSLDDCKPPLGFRQYQTILFDHARPEGSFDEILKAIGRKTGEQAPGASPQPGCARADANGEEAHCARARDLANEGRVQEAQKELEAALRIDPGSADANRQLAWLLYAQVRLGEAIPILDQALASSSRNHEAGALLISCHRALANDAAVKRTAELTIARAEQAIASGSDMGAAFASGARALAAMGHCDRARKWLRKALNLDPGNLAMRYNVAATLAAYLNDADAAVDALEPLVEHLSERMQLQLLEADPDWTSVRESGAFQALLSRGRKRVEAMETTALQGAARTAVSSPAQMPSIATCSSRPQGGC
jgi:tetratricopeptide (TPR) repeat protein